MTLNGLWEWVDATPLAAAIQQSAWLFPTIESIHVIALTFVVGSIAVCDLRLLGWASRDRPVIALTTEILPWTWGAFCVAVVTGALLFTTNASGYFENLPFRLKVLCLMLAGVNMLVFHAVTFRRAADWGPHQSLPFGAKVAGGLSLTFWIGVVIFGRWIGFTIH